jgi:hypothetical protein
MKSTQLFTLLILLLFFNNSFSQNNSKPANLVYVDKAGVLRFTKGNGEAAFFGVNYTAPFAYGYRSIKALNKDIRKEIDNDVYHMARIGVDAFRVHVWDVEISDSLGNLLNNEHLQLFDYLLAQLKIRGVKTIITPIAFWGNGYPQRDERTPGFSRVYGKGQANVNDTAIKAQENYIQQFFKHINPYTNTTYYDDPDIIAVEINNEPSHSGSKNTVTNYINRMIAALKRTGWTKPVFYNISQNPYYADAVAASSVDGFSFQWYPSGLVANREVIGNFLPNVDQYAIPYDTIAAYKNKAKMVYEFDAADLLQSNMYPAMARSFKTAGFQWATQFAYDPMATAYGNTEYQTHYLNLAYTPSKAISLLIAANVFRRVPKGKNYGAYPADSLFDVFRVSYRNNLSEMNSDTAFYYSNTTSTNPKITSKLKHIAGVGSSPIVHYEGSGAYFLDKLEEGVWRLEVMPDVIHIRDPFERASPKKEVTRIQWSSNAMQIVLPELGSDFNIKPLNDGNTFSPTVTGNKFIVKSGSYLVYRKEKTVTKWNAAASAGLWKLGEFAAPQPFSNTPHLVYHPVTETIAGKPLTIHLQAAGLDTADKITIQLSGGGGGRFGARPISFQRKTGNNYSVEIPADQLAPGIINYKIIIQKGADYYAYPGNIKGNPMAWDYYNNEAYELKVVPEGSSISLYNASTDKNVLTYNGSRRGESKLIPTERPGGVAFRMAANELSSDHVLGFQVFFGNQLSNRLSELSSYKTIVVRARTTSQQPINVKLVIITKDAFSFAANITLTSTFQDVEIPVSRLQIDSMLLLPRPYPGFMPLWFSPAGQNTFTIADIEKLQITIGSDVLPADFNKPYSMEIESVWLKK